VQFEVLVREEFLRILIDSAMIVSEESDPNGRTPNYILYRYVENV